ncbi:aromatic ring-hydroxylating dioxygenase subunit alpha [Streptomyces sp. GMY02]|uniref:aromatic ring-hydroxylating dioxygenase subunit alpha n=1 Tax=Streptomyces sp. GMY02 TaxID=1333528 RepID=UPI001C2B7FD5|nr:aromatic ring-hydroxylating dioxygenase subunit alpha [Streptomyces sp. GMY02]QXE33010.1 aromatic ring-hydroxylating dioxygenase subunit alpha [Streptomyces sp. GMY02]
MLRQDINELLTQTGPGTPMGELFRQYWIPALLAEELPENDSPPVRVKLLSERMVAFRDSEGRYGLVDEFCAHRGASLWFGRNEGSGLRCPYHGWKYDVTGQCVEVPSEADNSSFCRNVQLTAYPLVKIGDVLWTHMGDAATRPALPEFEFALVPPEQTYTSKRWQQCNWLQAFEGGIDSSHVTFLHSGGLKTDPLFRGAKGNEYNMNDTKPFFEVADSDGGLFVGARRNAEEGTYYWRITPWVMPNFTMVPPRGDHPIHGHFWVPIDDENCWTYSFDYHPVRALTDTERQAMMDGHGVHSKNIPGTYRPEANMDNDYLIDREAQKRGDTYSGVAGIAMQDASLQESMGPIVDRTRERLVPADSGIIKARQKLRKAAIALRDEGVTPPGVDPAHHRVRSAAVVLPQAESFLDSCREAVKSVPGVPQSSV